MYFIFRERADGEWEYHKQAEKPRLPKKGFVMQIKDGHWHRVRD